MYKHLNKLVNLSEFLHHHFENCCICRRLITFPMPSGHCSQLVILVLNFVHFFHQMNPQCFSEEADILQRLFFLSNSWFISYHNYSGSRVNP